MTVLKAKWKLKSLFNSENKYAKLEKTSSQRKEMRRKKAQKLITLTLELIDRKGCKTYDI